MSLERRKFKSLTIAFMSDDLSDIIKQRYAAYSRGSCLWSGDDDSFSVFGPGGVQIVPAGTPEYKAIMAKPETKIHYSIYFYLAEWVDSGAEMVMADGFGTYRIRTTSQHTVDNLLAAFHTIYKISGAHFSGVPFETRLDYRNGSDGSGAQRKFPVFTFVPKPAKGVLRLTSGNVRGMLEAARSASQGLALPPITPDTPESVAEAMHLDDAEGFIAQPDEPAVDDDGVIIEEAEFKDVEPEKPAKKTRKKKAPDPEPEPKAAPEPEPEPEAEVEISERDLKAMQHNKDPAAMTARWFALVKGTHLDNDDARHAFIAGMFDGVSSLSEAVDILKPSQFDQLILAAEAAIAEQQKETAHVQKMEQPNTWHPFVPNHARRDLITLVKSAPLTRLNAYPFFSMLLKRAVSTRGELTPEDVSLILSKTGGDDDAGNWVYSEPRTADLLMDFAGWENEDEAAENVLG